MGRGTYNGGGTIVGFRSGWFGNSPAGKKAKTKGVLTKKQSPKKAAQRESMAAAEKARREKLEKASEARKAARAATQPDPEAISKVAHRQQVAAARMRKIVVERRKLG